VGAEKGRKGLCGLGRWGSGGGRRGGGDLWEELAEILDADYDKAAAVSPAASFCCPFLYWLVLFAMKRLLSGCQAQRRYLGVGRGEGGGGSE